MFALLRHLISQGFRFSGGDGRLRCEYIGDGDPDPAALDMLERVRKEKDAALFLLRTRCQTCGGVIFWKDLTGHLHCLACKPIDQGVVDRLPIKTGPLPPAPAAANGNGKTCSLCGHFLLNGGSNPREGLGQCQRHGRPRFGVASGSVCQEFFSPPLACV